MATQTQKIAAAWLRSALDQAFWRWVGQKHPSLPNPDPDGRQDKIAPATLRGYAEGTPQTPQERRRQQEATRMVQRLHSEYEQATRATQQPEKKPLPPLEKIQKIVQDEGEVAVSALAETLEATEEEILEAALPDLMTGKIHLAPGPTFVDWSKKEDRGEAQPMPEIKKAFVRAYIKKALRQA